MLVGIMEQIQNAEEYLRGHSKYGKINDVKIA